jgi:hypothetical protein
MDFVKVPNKRVSLTEEDFTTLVSGNILVKEGVEISLQDIGYHRLKQIIGTFEPSPRHDNNRLLGGLGGQRPSSDNMWG